MAFIEEERYMGRKAQGLEPIFAALKKLVEVGKELRAPVGRLAVALDWTPATIGNYLRELYRNGVVSIVYGARRSIVAVKLLVSELPEKLREPVAVSEPPESIQQSEDNPKAPEAPKAEAVPEPIAAPEAPEPQATPVEPVRRTSIAVFVDYENAVRCAQKAGFRFSFTHLREEMCVRGNVVFAEVFVPPHVGKQEAEVRKLWDAGWTVIYCPLRHKDKDAVDQKLELRARDIIRETNVDGVVIVSEDADFLPVINYARNYGKSVERFLPSEHRELDGQEHSRELFGRPETRRWESAVDIVLGTSSAGTPDEQGRADFIRAIAHAMRATERSCSPDELALDPTVARAWRRIRNAWERFGYSIGMVQEAVRALIERKIAIRCHTTGCTYYVLTSDKALLEPFLAVPIHC